MRAAAALGGALCIGFLIASGAQHPANAADSDDPDWTSVPSDSVSKSAWPIAARKGGVEGHARLDCAVSAEGTLSDCKVLEEAPNNAGFAAAALALTPKYVRRVIMRDGHADPERIVVSIGWWNGNDVDQAAKVVATPSAAAKAAAWPADALRKGQAGFADLRCAVTLQGALRDCWILDETSPRGGFGEAALALAPAYHLKPALKHGAPIESHTFLRVAFSPDEKTDDYDTAPRMISGLDISALEALWPVDAHGKPGEATLRCVVTAQGALSDCRVQQEWPKGKGFGVAALLLAPSLKYQPATKSGRPVQAHTTQTIRWEGGGQSGEGFRMVTNLPWTTAPSSRDVLAAYPVKAIAKAASGQVVLRCSIDVRGGLFECLIVTERPGHEGFGQAALKLSRQFQFRPGEINRGLLSNLRVSISFQFVPPAGSAALSDQTRLDHRAGSEFGHEELPGQGGRRWPYDWQGDHRLPCRGGRPDHRLPGRQRGALRHGLRSARRSDRSGAIGQPLDGGGAAIGRGATSLLDPLQQGGRRQRRPGACIQGSVSRRGRVQQLFDLGRLVGGEFPLGGGHIGFDLRGRGRPGDDAGQVLMRQQPGEGQVEQ